MERSQDGELQVGTTVGAGGDCSAVVRSARTAATVAALTATLGLAIVGLGVLIVIAPSSVLGLTPPM